MVLSEGLSDSLEFSRIPQTESGTIQRLTYFSADGDFSTGIAESSIGSGKATGVSDVEAQVFLPSSCARKVVETWVTEAEIAREGLQCLLPLSSSDILIGSILEIDCKQYRVNRLEWAESKSIQAIEVEPSIYRSQKDIDDLPQWTQHIAVGDLNSFWLDIPIVRETDVPHAPYVAVSGNPWRGSAEIWSSNQDSDYALNKVALQRATMGFTLNELPPARSGLIDGGPALKVKMVGAALTSVSRYSMLNGSNLMAIGDGGQDNWEIFQFEEANVTEDSTFELRQRLRGQLGTDAHTNAGWPAGSAIVLIDSAIEQIEHPSNIRNMERHYRVSHQFSGGGVDSGLHYVLEFKGNGLRPLSVVHLSYRADSARNLEFSWIRRSRKDGDTWSGFDIPLAEEAELYVVRIKSLGGQVLVSYDVTEPRFLYRRDMQISDGCPASFDVEVAQISTSYGFGCSRTVRVLV